MSRPSLHRTGFTLVELLVVVAIIALLVSILLPSLNKAKEQAKIVVCASNLKSLGVAYSFYINENRDWIPASAGWGGDPPTWDWRIYKYYENPALLKCPSDNLDRSGWYASRTPTTLCPDIEEAPRSYAQGMAIGYRASSKWGDDHDYGGNEHPWTDENPYLYKITDLDSPADTIELGEQWEAWWYTGDSAPQPGVHGDFKCSGIEDGLWSSSVPKYVEDVPRRSPSFYHRENTSCNFLFCDGHTTMLLKTDKGLIDTDGDGRNDVGELYLYKVKK